MTQINLTPSENLLGNITNKVFAISLPRTGTKSLTKMMMILGFSTKHCPSIHLEKFLNNDEYDFYADTPIYSKSIMVNLIHQPSNKFIYIDRNIDSWCESFQKTKLDLAYIDYLSRDYNTMAKIGKLDRDCLHEFIGQPNLFIDNKWSSTDQLKDAFNMHKEYILSTIPSSQLLIYNFEQGWNPLCAFLEVPFIDMSIPHINKGTLFEKIV